MDGLLSRETVPKPAFSGFGDTDYADQAPPLQTIPVEGDAKSLRQMIRSQCPRQPGVYGMVDREGQLIYVGMSGRLRDRLLTYFTNGPPRAKEQRIAARTHQLVWELGGHELIARLRELELIRRWCPAYNVRGQPQRREIGYVFVSPGDAPRFRAGRRLSTATHLVWGPIRLTRQLRSAVSRLNRVFQLRDCPRAAPIHFAEQQTLFSDDRPVACMRGSLNTCLAPCSGGCSRTEYAGQIAAARAMLEGTDTTVVDRLERAMHDAAVECEFEKAAAYRDAWNELTFLSEQLQRIERMRRDFWFVYPVRCLKGSPLWVWVAGGSIVTVSRRPRSRSSVRECLQLLESRFSEREPINSHEDLDHMQLIGAWFHQRPGEMKKVLSPAQVERYCRQLERGP